MKPVTLSVLALLALATPAVAQDCPGAKSNDDCDRIMFEQADADLVRVVGERLVAITRRSTISPRVEAAQSLFTTAHQEWQRFRVAECKAYAAATSLISARTQDGLNYDCLHSLTRKRIEQIKTY